MSKLNLTGAWHTKEHKIRRNEAISNWLINTRRDVGELPMEFGDVLDEIHDSLAAGTPTKGWLTLMYEAGKTFVKGKKPFGAGRIGFDDEDFVHDFLVKESYIYEDYSVGMPSTPEEILVKLWQNWMKRIRVTVEQQTRIIYGYSLREIKADKVLSMEGIEARVANRMNTGYEDALCRL